MERLSPTPLQILEQTKQKVIESNTRIKQRMEEIHKEYGDLSLQESDNNFVISHIDKTIGAIKVRMNFEIETTINHSAASVIASSANIGGGILNSFGSKEINCP